jgi:membrane-associated protease RseP (regulator of RpoE activity)
MMVSEAGGFSSQTGAFGGSGLTFKNDGAAQRESKPAAPSIAASDPTGGAVSQVPAGVPAQEQPQKGADGATAKGSFGFTFIPTVLGGLITAVASDSPAAMAGVKPGEIIEAMNGKSIKGMAPAAITALLGRSGGSITLSVAGVGDVKVTKHQ